MSTTDEEARALDEARLFLMRLGSGAYRVESIRELRQEARDVARHFPLAPGQRWADMSEKIDRIGEVLSSHPDPCDLYDGDDVGSCGWKRAYKDVVWAYVR